MKATAIAPTLITILVTIAGGGSARAAEKETTGAAASGPEVTIRKLSDKLIEAALKGDAATMQELHADDYLSISALTGATGTKTEMVNNYKTGKLKYQSLDVSDVKVQFYGPTTALVTAKVVAKGKLADKEFSGTYWSGRLWVKRGGKWQCVFLQSTQAPTPARTG